ncbi:MAG: hypothetical protein ABIM46_04265 [candidate division WOR-3 bacterium]
MGQAQAREIRRILAILEEKLRKNPDSLRRFSPELFALVAFLIRPKPRQKRYPAHLAPGAQELERSEAFIKAFLGGENPHLPVLIRAFAMLAYMDKRDEVFYSSAEKLMAKLWPKGLPKRKARKAIRKGKLKGEDAVVSLMLGLSVGVTTGWDIYWIEFDPEKYEKRKRMLSVIGLFNDPEPMASVKHDELLYGSNNEDLS